MAGGGSFRWEGLGCARRGDSEFIGAIYKGASSWTIYFANF